eukprot:COSAG01_NODE_74474_length_212_cov_20.185841_1_plen_32_part_10
MKSDHLRHRDPVGLAFYSVVILRTVLAFAARH